MKTVFDNRMVAHVWAQQEQSDGRSHNGNFWFSGSTIYSYRTPIAKMHETKEGRKIALITPRSYSMTTDGKHKNAIRCAINTIAVPCFEDATDTRNLEYLVKQYDDAKEEIKRQRAIPSWFLTRARLENKYLELTRYCDAFGLFVPDIDIDADVAELETLHEGKAAKRNTPECLAKREKAAAKKERANRDAWLSGVPRIWCGVDGRGGAYLRVKGDLLETSQGAKVPLDHAIKAFRFILAVKDRGENWERNGEQVRVGQFQIDRIDATGDIVAGCHKIHWNEVSRIATEIGLV